MKDLLVFQFWEFLNHLILNYGINFIFTYQKINLIISQLVEMNIPTIKLLSYSHFVICAAQ